MSAPQRTFRQASRIPAQVASHGSAVLSAIVPRFFLAYSRLRVRNRTNTLEVGLPAPEFSLSAANREGVFTLGGLLKGGSLVLEFLRGTW